MAVFISTLIYNLKSLPKIPTNGVDTDYNKRAKDLLGRISDYLIRYGWVYMDSRISPYINEYK